MIQECKQFPPIKKPKKSLAGIVLFLGVFVSANLIVVGPTTLGQVLKPDGQASPPADQTLPAQTPTAKQRSDDSEVITNTIELKYQGPEGILARLEMRHAPRLTPDRDGYYHPEVTFNLLSGTNSLYVHESTAYFTLKDGKMWSSNMRVDGVVVKPGMSSMMTCWFSGFRIEGEDAHRLQLELWFFEESKRKIGDPGLRWVNGEKLEGAQALYITSGGAGFNLFVTFELQAKDDSPPTKVTPP